MSCGVGPRVRREPAMLETRVRLPYAASFPRYAVRDTARSVKPTRELARCDSWTGDLAPVVQQQDAVLRRRRSRCNSWRGYPIWPVSSAGERLVHTEEVGGANPSPVMQARPRSSTAERRFGTAETRVRLPARACADVAEPRAVSHKDAQEGATPSVGNLGSSTGRAHRSRFEHGETSSGRLGCKSSAIRPFRV